MYYYLVYENCDYYLIRVHKKYKSNLVRRYAELTKEEYDHSLTYLEDKTDYFLSNILYNGNK